MICKSGGFGGWFGWGTLLLWVEEKVLNSKVGISSLGLGSFQEVVFHCRLRGGANKGSGRVDSPNLERMAVLVLHGATLLADEDGLLQVWDTQVLGIWRNGAREVPEGLPGKGGGFAGGVSGPAAGFFGQGSVANAMGGARIVGPTGRDQAYVPRGEPTFRKGGGARGGGKGGFDTGAGCWGQILARSIGWRCW